MSISDINRIFEQLYNEYIGYISHYCYYKLSDYPEYAQDCIQDTFRVLFEKLSENVEIEYPKAFLIKTASNFVKLKYRDIDKEKNRHISIDYDFPDIPVEQEFFSIDYNVIDSLKNEILSELSDSEKELLSKICRNYENSYKTTKQLAEEYSCSETNIRQKIFVLRTKIKRLIKDKTKNL